MLVLNAENVNSYVLTEGTVCIRSVRDCAEPVCVDTRFAGAGAGPTLRS